MPGFIFRRIGGRIIPIRKSATALAEQLGRVAGKLSKRGASTARIERAKVAVMSFQSGMKSPLRFAGVPSDKSVPYNIAYRESLSSVKSARKTLRKLRRR